MSKERIEMENGEKKHLSSSQGPHQKSSLLARQLAVV